MTTLNDPTNAARDTPNIPATDATLHIGSSIFIAAPSTKVWSALTDTSTWPSWNSFVPRVTIRSQPDTPLPNENDSNHQTSSPSLSPVLRNGTRLTFHVRMDPTSTSTKPQAASDVQLMVVDYEAPNPETGTVGRIVWAADFDAPGAMAPSLLTAERVHEVRGMEAQVGWLVYVVRWMYGTKLQQNFELWVQDLKTFVEGQDSSS
ncbi:hypothetical protein NUU61_000754 [Penicillium alfredii]|uniref:Coenzyme Q-binding protein COQ10 START domain-containing protein n=1 Tax=Penicillium alfredii TaxID=1506179 RepID=A0A9W9GBI7_9EURO|nr:uncharacterized protein NUU61_000754 [Penicillium alfredii]KAJ5114995.1 hypothetical protein NUU61_000754 [Penicillium alfredii]